MDCPACKDGGFDGEVEYSDKDGNRGCGMSAAAYFLCDVCEAKFEIDWDADWTGDHYVDCSTPGKRLPG